MRNSKLAQSTQLKTTNLKNPSDSARYNFKSDKLTYRDFQIEYSKTPDKPLNLGSFVIPIDDMSPKLKHLVADTLYLDTALALADLKVRKSKNSSPSRQSIQAAITNYWNTILFLRTRGIFKLKDVEPDDLHFLCKQFAEGGWPLVLNITEKVQCVIGDMDEKSFNESIGLYKIGGKVVDGLKADFWNRKIGFIPYLILNEESKAMFLATGKKFGYTFSQRFSERFQMSASKPTEHVIRGLLSFFNHLHLIPNSVDKLKFYPFDAPNFAARKYAKISAERTENLGIEEATHILGKSFEWIYQHGPALVSILESCREKFIGGTVRFKENFLRDQNPFKDLASTLNIPLPNVWSMGLNPLRRRDYYYSVDHLIGALQGACAVAIAGLNARRSSEITDPNIGLRIKDMLVDPDSDLHRVNFYIEKSFQERHPFYITKVTYDAINLLIRLNKSCLPLDGTIPNVPDDESLFSCRRWLCKTGPGTPVAFLFSRGKSQTRSLSSFLSFVSEEYKDIDLKSHMWRRFFSLIFIYRYDHSCLQALSQQLRHQGIPQTIIYVTDNDARTHSEQIASKVSNNKQDKIREQRLLDSLLEDSKELNEAIHVVSREKFTSTVYSILNAESFSGGFPRLVRKLYKLLSKQLNFAKVVETEKAEIISTTLLSRGYSTLPMPHGQCNAPTNSHTYSGKCSNKGNLEREKASASFCQGCMFHSKSDGFIENLRQEVLLLEEDILSEQTPRSIRDEASEAKKVLLEIIDIHITCANKNSQLMEDLVENNAGK